MNFDFDNIDPFICTHLIYSFAGFDKTSFEIYSLDPKRDIEDGGYRKAVALKERNPNLKVLLAIGGWAEGGSQYSQMVSKKENRDVFVASVDRFLSEYGFDGLDLDWEYPGATDRGGQESDKMNVVHLCGELRSLFARKGWLLTMAIPMAQ